jgi:hypothetical protein
MYFSAATNTYYAANCDSNSYGVSDLTCSPELSPLGSAVILFF